MADLPDDCIASILARTTPWDATRMAGVCTAFKRVTESEKLWKDFLPGDYDSICEAQTKLQSIREIVKSLAAGVFLDDGLQKYMLLQRSRGVCRKLSVVAMDIAWGSDMRFWKWEHSRSSCFGKVAHLLAICWLEVRGTWSCSLPAGSYTAVWRLRAANPMGGRFHFLSWKKPLTFTVATADGQTVEKSLNLVDTPRKCFEDWLEFEVGTINVHGDGSSTQKVKLTYSIRETDCTYWKGGLYLDCLTLRPSGCLEDVPPITKDLEFSKIRGHPGVF